MPGMKTALKKVRVRLDILSRSLTLRRVALFGTVVPLVFMVLYSYLLLGPAHEQLKSVWGFPVLIASLGVAITAFSTLIFGAIGRLQRNVERLSRVAARQNAQLRALNEANLALAQETLTPSALQRVADLSLELVQARYAAIGVIGDDGKLKEFHTSGIDVTALDTIGTVPTGKGLLGLILSRTKPLRLDRIAGHPAAIGFPPGHPTMSTFLGVPILYRGRTVGSLYLADKIGGVFTSEDEEIAQLFANQAGVAIQNTRLYEQIQALAVETERSRISREMHDGLAQVLSYVNTKAQAVEAFLARGDVAEAHEHVKELGEAARNVYRDIREGILALRTQVGSGRSLRGVLDEYISEYEYQTKSKVKVNWRLDPDDMALKPIQEVQILRIVQESLTNVRKHSEATEIVLNLVPQGQNLEVEVNDNGKGFNPLALQRGEWPHFGLQTMQERAEAIGGTFEIESSPGTGTTVRVRVPLAVRASVAGGPL